MSSDASTPERHPSQPEDRQCTRRGGPDEVILSKKDLAVGVNRSYLKIEGKEVTSSRSVDARGREGELPHPDGVVETSLGLGNLVVAGNAVVPACARGDLGTDSGPSSTNPAAVK